MPNPCRFCGATDQQITNEHVWPDWLEDFMPPFTELGHTERWSSEDGRDTWRQPPFSATVRAFCVTCNTGWMSDIEGTAQHIIGPMVQGIPTTVDEDEQHAVASWVLLKGLVAAQTSRTPQPIPDYHYRRVFAARGVPANTALVWIGQRSNLADLVRLDRANLGDAHFMPITNVARRQFPLQPDLAEYIRQGGVFNAFIIQVGHFFGLAVQHDWPGLRMRPKPDTTARLAFLPIWPADGELRWPPLQPVDILGNPHRITEFFEMAPPVVAVVGP